MAENWADLNERAWVVADEMAARADELAVRVRKVCGARIIDAGVESRGSIAAGAMVARACMADLGQIAVVPGEVDGVPLPRVMVTTAHPLPACMASQYAGWQIKVGDYFAMGSGPFRAAYARETLYDHIGWRQQPARVVGVLETAAVPGDDVVKVIADKCRVQPDAVTLVVVRTASAAGGVQVVARCVETALHKLHTLGFDLHRVVEGVGWAPLPPIAKSDMAAIGRTNDAVLYGGQVVLYLTGDDDSLADVASRLPASASCDFGQPFARVFKQYDYDFYRIDQSLFSPAHITLHNIQSGRVHTAGQPRPDILRQSFFPA